jgi:hypothetical protein
MARRTLGQTLWVVFLLGVWMMQRQPRRILRKHGCTLRRTRCRQRQCHHHRRRRHSPRQPRHRVPDVRLGTASLQQGRGTHLSWPREVRTFARCLGCKSYPASTKMLLGRRSASVRQNAWWMRQDVSWMSDSHCGRGSPWHTHGGGLRGSWSSSKCRSRNAHTPPHTHKALQKARTKSGSQARCR